MGILLFWVGELGGELFTLYLSLWFVLVGLVWVHTGWQKIKVLVFPLVVILAMFPFPNLINTKINFQLRLISSKLGVGVLHIFGMSAYREGNVIDLGFTRLQVVDACSGLRYIIPLMVLALLLAYWFKAHMWKRVVLFLSIPLAILFNSFRIAATGVRYRFFRAEATEEFFHGLSAWIIFIAAMLILLLFMSVLKSMGSEEYGKLGGGDQKADDGDQRSGISNLSQRCGEYGDNHSLFTIFHSLLSPVFTVSIAILLITLGLFHSIEFREKVPAGKSFLSFPLAIGNWHGQHSKIDKKSCRQVYQLLCGLSRESDKG